MSCLKIIHGIVGGAVTGLVLVNSLPNLLPSLFCKKRDGLENVEVPEKVEETLDEVSRRMQLHRADKVRLFIKNGFGSYSAGSTWLPGGAIIGLSRLVLYTNLEEIRNSGITFNGKKLSFQRSFGKKLSKALLLNENELKFLIAHEVSHLHEQDPAIYSASIASWLFVTYKAVPMVLAKLPQNHLLKFAVQFSLWFTSFWLMSKQLVALRHNQEYKADEKAAMLGIEYAEGGLSYFVKYMEVNKVLRELNGGNGNMFYSIEGNDLNDLMHPKLSDRLLKLRQLYANKYLQNKVQ